MENNSISLESVNLIEQKRKEFENGFILVVISDTVKEIIQKSLPIQKNEETGVSEIIDDEHAIEINDLIGRSALDLTNDAIKGKMIKTKFNEGEIPENYLNAISQSVEDYIHKESVQRANWFKLQIESGKIPDISKNYTEFNSKLNKAFEKFKFTVENYKLFSEEQKSIAKTYEEKDIIETIRESVLDDVEKSETRQNHLIEMMQTVQETKKEYEEELEEKTNPKEDIDMAPIDDNAEIENDELNNSEENTENNDLNDDESSMENDAMDSIPVYDNDLAKEKIKKLIKILEKKGGFDPSDKASSSEANKTFDLLGSAFRRLTKDGLVNNLYQYKLFLTEIGKIDYRGKKRPISIYNWKNAIEKTQELRKLYSELRDLIVISSNEIENNFCDIIDIEGDIFRFTYRNSEFLHLTNDFVNYVHMQLQFADDTTFYESLEDENLNKNAELPKKEQPRRDGADLNNGEGIEGIGGMAPNQNMDNFPSYNDVNIGDEYKGPIEDSEDDEIIETPNGDKIKIENTSNGENADDYSVKTVDPVKAMEEEDDMDEDSFTEEHLQPSCILNSNNASEEDIYEKTMKILPISLSKFEIMKIYSSEALLELLFKVNYNKQKYVNAINRRINSLEELLNKEKHANTNNLKEKLNIFTKNWKLALENYTDLNFFTSTIGINTNSINNNDLFSLSVVKNILNRNPKQIKKGMKLKRILKKDYNRSIENIVDTAFILKAMKRKIYKSSNIEKSMENLALYEEKFNESIKKVDIEIQNKVSSLKSLLDKENFTKLFLYDELLLDYKNALTRIKEDEEKPSPDTFVSRNFIDRVIKNLEKKGYNYDESLESAVQSIVKNNTDSLMTNSNSFERILLSLGKKELNKSLESFDRNDISNSKLFTKAKTYLTIKTSAEALGISSEDFISSFNNTFR